MYRSIVTIALLLFALAVSPARAHQCPDSITQDLYDILRETRQKYSTRPLSEEAISNYRYIANMATRPEDQLAMTAACMEIAETLYVNGVLEEREEDYSSCPENTKARFLGSWGLDPNSYISNVPYLPIVHVSGVYPAEAASKQLSGTVVVEFTLTTKGTVRSPEIIESSDTVFNRPALRDIKRFKYKPRLKDGKPIKVRGVTVTITFDYEHKKNPAHCD